MSNINRKNNIENKIFTWKNNTQILKHYYDTFNNYRAIKIRIDFDPSSWSSKKLLGLCLLGLFDNVIMNLDDWLWVSSHYWTLNEVGMVSIFIQFACMVSLKRMINWYWSAMFNFSQRRLLGESDGWKWMR